MWLIELLLAVLSNLTIMFLALIMHLEICIIYWLLMVVLFITPDKRETEEFGLETWSCLKMHLDYRRKSSMLIPCHMLCKLYVDIYCCSVFFWWPTGIFLDKFLCAHILFCFIWDTEIVSYSTKIKFK